MHEMSIAQSLAALLREEMEKAGARTLRSVRLEIGRMSAIVPDALSFGFQVVTADTDLSAADASVGFLIGFILFSSTINPLYLLFIMWLAQIPDWIEAPYHFGFKFPPFTWMKYIQHLWHTKLGWPWGLLPQLAILAFAIFLSFS